MKTKSPAKSLPKPTHAAFLRGINVGGNKVISMARLKEALEGMGLKGVTTLLASGNVVFASPKSASQVTGAIEKKLKETFGHEIGVMVRTIDDLRTLAKADPFKGIEVTPDIRLYVTFLSEKPKDAAAARKIAGKGFRVLRVSNSEVCSVLEVSKTNGTPEFMKVLEANFGKKITTRNWNTIARVLTSCGDNE